MRTFSLLAAAATPDPAPSTHRPRPCPPTAAGGEEITMPAMAPVLSGTPGATRWAGPQLGEHTEAVMGGELGLGEAEIRRLREAGAI